MIALVLAALAQMAPTPASDPPAQVYYTGNQLYDECQIEEPMLCVAYIIGVADTVQDAVSAGSLPRFVCYNNRVTPQQLKDVVVRYLRAHPETRDRTAPSIIAVALREAFPCPPR